MRSGVPCSPGETESKRIGACLSDCLVELFLQVRKQRGLAGSKARRISCQCYRPVQFIVSQPADVVKIERVGGIIGTGDVSVGPLCRLLQIVSWISVGQARRQIGAGLESKVQLHRAQFQVVAPFRLGIETEWNNG